MNGQQSLTEVAYEEIDSGTINIVPSPVTIRKAGLKGRGVFAVKKLKKGEVAIVGKPVARLPERTWQSIQLGIDTHVRIDAPFEFLTCW